MTGPRVELYEDNAGGLYLWVPAEGCGWAGLERVGASFGDDVAAIRDGETDDWTVERLAERPHGTLVAWIDGAGEPRVDDRAMGLAARRYVQGRGP